MGKWKTKEFERKFEKAAEKGLEKVCMKSVTRIKRSFRSGLGSDSSSSESSPTPPGGTPAVRRGDLRRSIGYSKPGKEGKKIVSRIGVRGSGGTGGPGTYGPIQEYGGTISAKANGYLHFKVHGQWAMVKSVTIPPRPFIRPERDRLRRGALKRELAIYMAKAYK